MVVLFLTIPLMVLGLAVALGPLALAMLRDDRAVEAGAPVPVSASQVLPASAPRSVRHADETVRDDRGVLVGV